ncbi:MAG TPA: SgcJ/EcaC family oxidoreductase [Chryseolinea sp.]
MAGSKEEVEAIALLFQQAARAWNEGNGGLYASFFTEDCDYVTFDGRHLRGNAEHEAFHQKLFTGFLRGSKLVGRIKAIRFINPDVAIVHQTGGVQLRFQKRFPGTRLSINTNVLVREQGTWKISAFHNCRIQKPPFIFRLIGFFKN